MSIMLARAKVIMDRKTGKALSRELIEPLPDPENFIDELARAIWEPVISGIEKELANAAKANG